MEDVAAMKLIAVAERGSIKDFIDVHALLKAGWNISALLDTVNRKYKDVNYNLAHILKSLTYFADADNETMPLMYDKISWVKIKREISAAVADELGR